MSLNKTSREEFQLEKRRRERKRDRKEKDRERERWSLVAVLRRVVKYTSHQLILIKMRLTLAARSLVSFRLERLSHPSVYSPSPLYSIPLSSILDPLLLSRSFCFLLPDAARLRSESLCLTAKNIKILFSRYYEATYVSRLFCATVFSSRYM